MKDKCIALFWAYMENQITREAFYGAWDKLENGNLNLFESQK